MIREQRALAAIVAIVVASLVTATLYASPGPATSSTTSTTTTSFTTTTTSSITTTTTSSITTTTSVVSTTTASSFSFSPSGPLQVISVSAQTTKDSVTGKVYLTLLVAYKNIGSDAVYMTRGCGSSLSANISSTSIIAENQGVRCLCAEYIAAMNPGDSGNALTPGCWSGVVYQVVLPGTISVEMALSYWLGQNEQNPGKTTIQASFTLA